MTDGRDGEMDGCERPSVLLDRDDIELLPPGRTRSAQIRKAIRESALYRRSSHSESRIEAIEQSILSLTNHIESLDGAGTGSREPLWILETLLQAHQAVAMEVVDIRVQLAGLSLWMQSDAVTVDDLRREMKDTERIARERVAAAISRPLADLALMKRLQENERREARAEG